jgi:hypothetical protein
VYLLEAGLINFSEKKGKMGSYPHQFIAVMKQKAIARSIN